MKKKKRKNQKNISIIIILTILILLICTFTAINLYEKKNKLKVTLIPNLNIEINTSQSLLSLIKNIENGEILTKNTSLNTSKLGKQSLEILIKNNFNKEEKYTFEINIVDTTKPSIESKNEIITYIGTNLDLLKDVLVTDNSNEEIEVFVEGTYDINTIGEYTLNYIAKDSSGNKTTQEFILKVIKDPKNYTFKTNNGYNAKVINGITYIDGILIANKTYSLPNNYGSGLTKETQKAFNKMDADATALELNLYISSGYRSYYDQKYIYNNYVKKDGQSNADTYSARAGHSEHQTGLAFDLNTINDSFTNTPEGQWVHDNCYKYGLILRYPKDKENITGYMHESWHLRYVGIDLATKLYNNGDWITLEEYFGITSKYQS